MRCIEQHKSGREVGVRNCVISKTRCGRFIVAMHPIVGKRKMTNKFVELMLCIGALGFASLASAQSVATAESASEGHLEEIVVTANKRAENAQKVPVAISSVTSASLEEAGVHSTADLAQTVPGLTIQNSFDGMQPHLRGIGTTAISSGNESSVATYIDGVYVANMSGALLELSNIAQIDVLKGPQGTLFGRNADAGVIQVRTKDPVQDFHFDVSATYGNYQTASTNLYVTGGLSSTVAADFAAYGLMMGRGYGVNRDSGTDIYRTKNDYGFRTKWLITPSDALTLRIAADSSTTNNNGLATFRAVPGHPVNIPNGSPYYEPGGNPWNASENSYDPYYVYRQKGASITADYDFGIAKLTSISAYRDSAKSTFFSVFSLPVHIEGAGWNDLGRQISQEIQVGSSSSKINWVTGLYFLDSEVGYDPFSIIGPALAPLEKINFTDRQTAKAGAIYGQATVPLTDRTNLTVGLRYSIENVAIEGNTQLFFSPPLESLGGFVSPTDSSKTFKRPTWRFALDHQFTDDVMAYISANRGFKSGVYPTIPTGGPGAQPVEPEILDAYEIGLKTDFFDNRFRINLAGFYYDYKNLQVNVFRATSALLENGAAARIYGIDLDLVAKVTNSLSIAAGAEVIHDRFTSFPSGSVTLPVPASQGGGNVATSYSLAGNRIPYAPDAVFNVGPTYNLPVGNGNITFSADFSYNSGWYSGAENFLRQPSYSVINARVLWTPPAASHLDVTVWGKNLGNKAYSTYFITQVNPYGLDEETLAPPRTYGITVHYRM